MPLSQDRVRALLDYDSESGHLTWKVNRGSARIGFVAGVVSEGYRLVRLDQRLHKAHVLVWLWVTGESPDGDVDHIDGDGLNNRFDNLRVLSHTENMWNVVRARRDSGTGVMGVTFHRPTGKWRARIRKHGVEQYLGLFATVEEASAAYWAAKQELHGESIYQVRLAQSAQNAGEVTCHS